MVKLLNVDAPIDCGPVPSNTTVPAPGANVPFRIQFPPKEIVAAPLWNVVPLSMTMFPATSSVVWARRTLLELRVRSPVTVAGFDSVAIPADLSIKRLL